MQIRPLQRGDAAEWARMRCTLWPDQDPAELRAEAENHWETPAAQAVFVCARPDGKLGAFVEVGLRSVVDSAVSSPVGYVEAWYVDPDLRRTGIGRALMARGEQWAREQGCTEMGSDTELENTASQAAHKAIGYGETGVLVNFLKRL